MVPHVFLLLKFTDARTDVKDISTTPPPAGVHEPPKIVLHLPSAQSDLSKTSPPRVGLHMTAGIFMQPPAGV